MLSHLISLNLIDGTSQTIVEHFQNKSPAG